MTKIDGIFKGREKEEGERKTERMAGAQGWPDHFFIALGNVCEPSGNVAGQLVPHGVKHNVTIRPKSCPPRYIDEGNEDRLPNTCVQMFTLSIIPNSFVVAVVLSRKKPYPAGRWRTKA